MKYIDADKLLSEIDRQEIGYNTDGKHTAEYNTCRKILDIITSLQQEQPDYKGAVQLVFEEELTPFKDGNQWCFLLGHNIQDGICGFGDTVLDAAVAFYKDYTNINAHIGELKQGQPEVDLRKEIAFRFNGKEVSWDEIPLEYRKHDYPYYFDGDIDCYPFKIENKQ